MPLNMYFSAAINYYSKFVFKYPKHYSKILGPTNHYECMVIRSRLTALIAVKSHFFLSTINGSLNISNFCYHHHYNNSSEHCIKPPGEIFYFDWHLIKSCRNEFTPSKKIQRMIICHGFDGTTRIRWKMVSGRTKEREIFQHSFT